MQLSRSLLLVNLVHLCLFRTMSVTAAASSTGMIALKSALRREVTNKLKALDRSAIADQSAQILTALQALPEFQASKTICCYISFGKEVETLPILTTCFNLEKEIIIPKVTGPKSNDMVMLSCSSAEELRGYTENKWGIPEPEHSAPDLTHTKDIDLIFVPGIAFDKSCNRVGRGRGYYDCFLSKVLPKEKKPITVGLCFDEQVGEVVVPTEEHDIPLDYIITPTRTLKST